MLKLSLVSFIKISQPKELIVPVKQNDYLIVLIIILDGGGGGGGKKENVSNRAHKSSRASRTIWNNQLQRKITTYAIEHDDNDDDDDWS